MSLPTISSFTHGVPSSPAADSRQPRASAMNWWQIYEAANRSDFKGYFYIPFLTPKEQQQWLTRRALQERIDFLYKNVGAVTLIIDGLGMEEVGTGLWPKWESSSAEYNSAMTDLFHEAGKDPRIFDSAGESDYYTAQLNVRRMIRLYGDCAGQLIRPSPGSFLPQMSLIPGYRIENADVADDLGDFRDGIQRNPAGRATAYSILTEERSSVTAQIVPASDLLHFHDPFLPNQNRGISCLAAASKSLYRREDIKKALNNGTLARERMGFAVETGAADNSGPSIVTGGDGTATTVENPTGTSYTLQQFFGPNADEQIQIPRLPNGAKISTIESNRPGTAVVEFLNGILSETCWASLYPPEYVYFLAGMGQGTVARLVNTRVNKIKASKRNFQLMPQMCHRWHVFFAWQVIKSGLLQKQGIAIPPDWYKHKINADADNSVDVGREGALYDTRVATGKMSIPAYHALAGEDDSDVEDANFAVYTRRLQKLAAFNKLNKVNFTYWDMWPRTAQAQPPAPADETDGKEKDPDKDKDEDEEDEDKKKKDQDEDN